MRSSGTRAFDTVVACYWKPLYKYARVAWRRSPEDAEDLTQSFFTRAFEKASLARMTRQGRASGRFCGFCSTATCPTSGRRDDG